MSYISFSMQTENNFESYGGPCVYVFVHYMNIYIYILTSDVIYFVEEKNINTIISILF